MTPARETYEKISRKASKLNNLIIEAMDDIKAADPSLPVEWRELHDLLQLSGIIASAAARYRDRADKPVPYALSEGLRDLDAAAHDPFTYQSPSGPRDFTDLF